MKKLSVKEVGGVQADHNRLVRELDVLMCGEEGAAKQASLCDLVAYFPQWKEKMVAQARESERERIDDLLRKGLYVVRPLPEVNMIELCPYCGRSTSSKQVTNKEIEESLLSDNPLEVSPPCSMCVGHTPKPLVKRDK